MNNNEAAARYNAIPQLTGVRPELREYIEEAVFPRYAKFFSHGIVHIYQVIENALMLAEYYHKDLDIAYTAAAYHDAGLKIDREHHESASGEFIASDTKLLDFFSPAEIQVIREAAEDHRGSRRTPPRSFYGRIVSDADRDFELETLAWRMFATSIKNYTQLTTFEQHFTRCYDYMSKRMTDNGHFNLWTNNPILLERRAKFEQGFSDRESYRKLCAKIYTQMENEGIFAKVLNYYEDF